MKILELFVGNTGKLTSFQSGLHSVVEVEVDVGKNESGKG